MNATNTQTQDNVVESKVNEPQGELNPFNFTIRKIPNGSSHPLGKQKQKFLFNGYAYEVYEVKRRNRILVRLLGPIEYKDPFEEPAIVETTAEDATVSMDVGSSEDLENSQEDEDLVELEVPDNG